MTKPRCLVATLCILSLAIAGAQGTPAAAEGNIPEPCAKLSYPPPAWFHCPSPYVEMENDDHDEIFERAWYCRETDHALGLVRGGDGCGGGQGPGIFPGWQIPAISAARAGDYGWPVVRVIDGDTVAVDASSDMPPELASVSVRLRGVDTPEKGGRAKCDTERTAGQAATAFTTDALAVAESVFVRDPAWGKWGGRVIADLIVDGRSLSAALIETGHGRPYDGGRRGSWCE